MMLKTQVLNMWVLLQVDWGMFSYVWYTSIAEGKHYNFVFKFLKWKL